MRFALPLSKRRIITDGMGRWRTRLVRLGIGVVVLNVASACTYDFDQFYVNGAEGGTGGASGGSDAVGGSGMGGAVGGLATGETGGGQGAVGGAVAGGSPPAGAGGGSPREGGVGGVVAGGSPPVATGGASSGGGGASGGIVAGGAPPGATGGGGTGGTETGGASSGGGGATGGVVGGDGPTLGGQGGVQAGGTGGSACDLEHQLCGDACVDREDPDWGCGDGQCQPCAIPNGAAACSSGACVLDRCDADHLDCDGEIDNGCEVGRGNFSDEHCGGCDNPCSAQGYSDGFVCQSGACVCTSPAHCSDRNGTFDCVAGVCACEGNTCRPGETCSLKVGPDWVCGCHGEYSCAAGTTCCSNPPGCRDLLRDSENCGACGWRCPQGTICVDGACA
jgi:hypothetical protein